VNLHFEGAELIVIRDSSDFSVQGTVDHRTHLRIEKKLGKQQCRNKDMKYLPVVVAKQNVRPHLDKNQTMLFLLVLKSYHGQTSFHADKQRKISHIDIIFLNGKVLN
jgi:hypothetical protein